MKVKLHYVHKLRAHKMKRMKVLFKYLSPALGCEDFLQ